MCASLRTHSCRVATPGGCACALQGAEQLTCFSLQVFGVGADDISSAGCPAWLFQTVSQLPRTILPGMVWLAVLLLCGVC